MSILGERLYIFYGDQKIRPDIKFIISGDYNQLKPVNDKISIDADKHAIMDL